MWAEKPEKEKRDSYGKALLAQVPPDDVPGSRTWWTKSRLKTVFFLTLALLKPTGELENSEQSWPR